MTLRRAFKEPERNGFGGGVLRLHYDHEGRRVCLCSFDVDTRVLSLHSLSLVPLCSLLSACFRNELVEPRREAPTQSDAFFRHSNPPNRSVYP